MGLTLHYRLAAPAELSARGAAALVRRMHRLASQQVAAGRVAEVLPISSDRVDLERWANAWRVRAHPTERETSVGVQIAPEAGWIFPVEVGEGCELLWLGLCRYPTRVRHGEGTVATRLGARWQLAGFCKTHYAGLHGWEHFARCHRGAVELIVAARALGLRVKLDDEGGYWPHRSERTLRGRLERLNGSLAALAGALKDATEAAGGAPVVAPILAHPQFERLEAQGWTEEIGALARQVVDRGVRPG